MPPRVPTERAATRPRLAFASTPDPLAWAEIDRIARRGEFNFARRVRRYMAAARAEWFASDDLADDLLDALRTRNLTKINYISLEMMNMRDARALFEPLYRNTVLGSARSAAEWVDEFTLTDRARRAGIVQTGMNFRLVNPEATRYAKNRAGDLIKSISDMELARIRDLVAMGFEAGVTVRDTARRIREWVGLLPKQAARMARLEATAGWTPARVNREVARQIARRALLIARTETIRSANAGQRMTWRRALDEGLLPPGAAMEWRAAMDERTCPVCGALDGQVVAVDGTGGAFEAGGGIGTVFQPPAHPACRCALVCRPWGKRERALAPKLAKPRREPRARRTRGPEVVNPDGTIRGGARYTAGGGPRALTAREVGILSRSIGREDVMFDDSWSAVESYIADRYAAPDGSRLTGARLIEAHERSLEFAGKNLASAMKRGEAALSPAGKRVLRSIMPDGTMMPDVQHGRDEFLGFKFVDNSAQPVADRSLARANVFQRSFVDSLSRTHTNYGPVGPYRTIFVEDLFFDPNSPVAMTAQQAPIGGYERMLTPGAFHPVHASKVRTVSGMIVSDRYFMGLEDVLVHEYGHVLHGRSLSIVNRSSLKSQERIASNLIYYGAKTNGGWDFSSAQAKALAQSVSGYAGQYNVEFVAEVFTAVAYGQRLSPEVAALYKKLFGVGLRFARR
jgi:hypothetical protein